MLRGIPEYTQNGKEIPCVWEGFSVSETNIVNGVTLPAQISAINSITGHFSTVINVVFVPSPSFAWYSW